MAESKFTLDPQDRALVLNTVVDTCADRAWDLFCVHIRTNHVHAVLQTDVPIDRAASYLKARYVRAEDALSRSPAVPD